MAGASRTFGEIVTPYLELEGVVAAVLVSHDGLLVTSAGGGGLNLETLAAYAAAALSPAAELAAKLDSGPLGKVMLETGGHELMLAPLSGKMILMLVGAGKGSLSR